MRQPGLKVISQTCTRSQQILTNFSDKDFFGIKHITNKDIAGCFASGTKLQQDKFIGKYKPLLRPANALNKQVEVDVTFGKMRFDHDNTLTSHGQFEIDNQIRSYEPEKIKQLFVKAERPTDQQTNIESLSEDEAKSGERDGGPKVGENSNPNYQNVYKIADVEPIESLPNILKFFKTITAKDLARYANRPPLTFFFDFQLPGESSQSSNDQVESNLDVKIKLSGYRLDESELEISINEADTEADSKPPLVFEPEKDQIPIQDLDPDSEYHRRNSLSEVEFDKTLDEKYDIGEPKSPLKALDYLKKVRAQELEPTAKNLKQQLEKENPYPLRPTIKLDSKGFRIYTNQVPNWSACRRVDILASVRRSILYHNYGILAVNKPYGIASHSEERVGENSLNMNSLVQELSAEFRIEKVYLAHRLDKTTTGVLLFATSQERAKHLNKLFKSDQIKKTYWCITKGIPDPQSGIIDIPVGEFRVGGRTRSCLAPERIDKDKQLSARYREARRAITEYNVIENTKYAALVEVKPRSGVKHQIRCHLGFGLAKPILGDHKYSHLTKIVPQVLSIPLLNALHLRQSKVRTLPIHLHAKSIVIPGAKTNGETLFISAPVPSYFVDNLKSLGLLSESIRTQATRGWGGQ